MLVVVVAEEAGVVLGTVAVVSTQLVRERARWAEIKGASKLEPAWFVENSGSGLP
jgi:hypothetical protein